MGHQPRGTRYGTFALLALACVAAAARADLPAAKLHTVFPPGAQRGTFIEVGVTGADLDDPAELRFSHPGLTAKPALDAAGKVVANRFVVAVWPDVPPDAYDVRVVGRFGVSNPRSFVVGEAPEVSEGPANTSPGGATEVPLGGVANGQCGAGAVDHFRFSVPKGRRVLIDCAAAAIDSKAQPVLTLTDAAGRELDRSRSGELIDFTAPAEGQYGVRVHDAVYRGGPEYFYRLSISTGPHVDFVLPPAGQAGSKGKYVVFGRNLPGGSPAAGVSVGGKPLEQLAADIELPAAGGFCRLLSAPAQGVVEGVSYRVRAGQQWSVPALVGISDVVPLAEQDPNDAPAAAQKVAVPCEIDGRFFPRGDRDWFAFDAKKGDVFWIEVYCQRLGLPCDPFLLVQRVAKDDKGVEQPGEAQEVYNTDTNVGGTDINTSSRDPSYRLEAKEDGAYRVQVRDLFNALDDDPRLTYRLSIRREKPDFQLAVAAARQDPKDLPSPPLLRKGASVPVRVVAVRRDGFAGEIILSAEGLPAGVTAAPATISAGANSAALVFTAAEDAAGWAGFVHVVGKAQLGGAGATREARAAAVLWGGSEPPAGPVRSRLTPEGLPLAVSGAELSPLTIALSGAKELEVVAGATLKIPLKIAARLGPAGKLKLKPAGHPVLDDQPEVEIDAGAADATVTIDLAQRKLPPGTHTLFVRAEGPVKYLRNPDAAKAADEAKRRAESLAAEAAAAAKQAGERLAAAKAGADAEAAKAAEKAAGEADAKAKEAEKQKQDATKAAADAGPKDTPAVLFSAPFVVKVTAPAK